MKNKEANKQTNKQSQLEFYFIHFPCGFQRLCKLNFKTVENILRQ